MSVSIQDLHGRSFDVIVIGGGINGASAAQNLSAAGYSCLLVDKGDFGSGASGRSSRMLHIGLRFFEARNPVRHFALNPGRFLDALRGARQAVQAVAEHLPTAGDRIWPYRMCFPVYDDSQFKSWHVSAGLKLLSLLSGGKVPLEPETVRRGFADKVPFFGDFRTPDRIRSLSLYNEYKFDWPERFCVDMAMDAQRNGAIVMNYCTARIGEQADAGNWQIELLSSRGSRADPVVVTAPVVLNMAGTWIDQVLLEVHKREQRDLGNGRVEFVARVELALLIGVDQFDKAESEIVYILEPDANGQYRIVEERESPSLQPGAKPIGTLRAESLEDRNGR